MNPTTINKIQTALLRWYRKNRRSLPWRETSDPYAIWVSEIMLQQTQVQTAIPYYIRFLLRFPNLETLARANLSTILKVWEGLGYYARARNLHRTAQVLVKKYHGVFPNTYQELKTLPGVGDYTAAAIASIVFKEPVPGLDGNARRVIARWMAIRFDLNTHPGNIRLRRAAERLIPLTNPGAWNQAVMELGATLCLPRKPTCSLCPVVAYCRAAQSGKIEKIPFRKKRPPLPHYQVTAGLITAPRHKGQILIARRLEQGLLGGLWEFPGGKQEPGETLPDCLRRELLEELDIEVEVQSKFCQVEHAYSHFRITLYVYWCRIRSGKPKALDCAEWTWTALANLENFAFPKADRQVIQKLLKLVDEY